MRRHHASKGLVGVGLVGAVLAGAACSSTGVGTGTSSSSSSSSSSGNTSSSSGGVVVGGGTSGTSGGGGTLPRSCSPAAGDTTCASCLKTYCCNESTACSDSQHCSLLVQCLSTCETQACADTCDSLYSDARSDYQDLQQCASTSCNTPCGG